MSAGLKSRLQLHVVEITVKPNGELDPEAPGYGVLVWGSLGLQG